MRFLSFLRREKRATIKSNDAYLSEFFGVRASASPDAVLSNIAVAARCVMLRSELLASMPLFLFRRDRNGGRELADDNSLYFVLHDQFNEYLTAFEARELLVRSLDLYGNAYARIERNARGQVTALYPLSPGVVTIERLPTGRLRYKVSDPRGGVTVVLAEEMLHIRGASRDGVVGQSPIQIARGSLSLALTQNETASALMTNSMNPSALITVKNTLAENELIRMSAWARKTLTGPSNAGRVAVLDNDAKLTPITFTPSDAEFLETRKLSNEDVARIFGLPPTSVGITDKATYSNVEHEGRALVQNAIGPLASRIEAAMQRCLLTDMTRRSLYVEHELNGLLRGDVQARFNAYRVAREIGAMSANDVRKLENLPPIEQGDTYQMPANWVPLGTVSSAQGQQG